MFYILQSIDTLNAPYTTLVNNVLGGDRQRWLAWAVYKRNTQCYANLKKTSYFEIKYYFTVLYNQTGHLDSRNPRRTLEV